ncbi:MAG: hypothetical protein ACP5I1_13115, partial [Candidatus Hinthialibacter sp.]
FTPYDPYVIDCRYSPPDWQTAICLPDDWQKTLVGKDGSLLYDFQNRSGFMTRIKWGVEQDDWLGQELLHPRIPIVKTQKRSGEVLITETAFAVAPRLGASGAAGENRPTLKRMLSKSTMANWASPPEEFDPAFRHIAVANKNSIHYRFCPPDKSSYTVVLGLCEGYWEEAGKRPMELFVEGDESRVVDAVANQGANVPGVYSFHAKDEDEDGWIDIRVNPVKEAPDQNVILNVIWIFPADEVPSDEDLMKNSFSQQAIVQLDCGGEAQSGPPRNDVVVIEYTNPTDKSCVVTPQVSIETKFSVREEVGNVLIGNHTKIALPPWPYSIRTDEGEKRVVGDMPHNWASAEFIRLVRHLLVLERGNELHLFEGLPPTWLQPGAETRLRNIVTEFGPMSLELVVSDEGKKASLFIQPPRRNPPEKIIVHVESWPGCKGVLCFEPTQEIRKTISLIRD